MGLKFNQCIFACFVIFVFSIFLGINYLPMAFAFHDDGQEHILNIYTATVNDKTLGFLVDGVISVGDEPKGVAVGDDYIYATTFGEGVDGSKVFVMQKQKPYTKIYEYGIDVGNKPWSLGFQTTDNGEELVFVTNWAGSPDYEGSISIIFGNTIGSGSTPNVLDLDLKGTMTGGPWGVANCPTSIYITNDGNNKTFKISLYDLGDFLAGNMDWEDVIANPSTVGGLPWDATCPSPPFNFQTGQSDPSSGPFGDLVFTANGADSVSVLDASSNYTGTENTLITTVHFDDYENLNSEYNDWGWHPWDVTSSCDNTSVMVSNLVDGSITELGVHRGEFQTKDVSIAFIPQYIIDTQKYPKGINIVDLSIEEKELITLEFPEFADEYYLAAIKVPKGVQVPEEIYVIGTPSSFGIISHDDTVWEKTLSVTIDDVIKLPVRSELLSDGTATPIGLHGITTMCSKLGGELFYALDTGTQTLEGRNVDDAPFGSMIWAGKDGFDPLYDDKIDPVYVINGFKTPSSPNDNQVVGKFLIGNAPRLAAHIDGTTKVAISLAEDNEIKILKIIEMDGRTTLLPLMQVRNGVASIDVVCKSGFELLLKIHDNNPICVKPATADILQSLGWVVKP